MAMLAAQGREGERPTHKNRQTREVERDQVPSGSECSDPAFPAVRSFNSAIYDPTTSASFNLS